MQTSIQVERLWRELSTADLSASWLSGIGPAVVRAVAAGQLLAASTGQTYVDAMVAADGLSSGYRPDASRVNARAFSGVAADGRTLDSLLYLPVIRTKTLIKGGLTLQEAMLGGLTSLQRMVASEVADAGLGAAGVAMVGNRTVTGYIRTVRPGACARCVILAGRWYRWSADFQRHKRCQCYGVPSTKSRPGRHTDPLGFFRSLSRAEQDRRFGAGGAQAIRDGADIYKVVNASRGVQTLDAYGRKVVATLEGVTKRGDFYQNIRRETEQKLGVRFARTGADVEQGLPRFHLKTPRLMPAELYRLAEDRDELIGLLRRFGYLH
ncbi:hypothetical protein [Streptomyces griseofuscus]|uniref:Uncharacterized protein n=1 Tax=Streptomyces griseofuscus TaxID=146922 RepID=A0A3R8S8G2_9ACTN|nr:hypothetical protein [Streptomyces griseofuscus]RRQ81724.1 hypothetical protein CQW44_30610 [Streptomyces griseofuscus]